MSKPTLHEWLEERRQNASLIAQGRQGAERDGWLEDADYFARAIAAVDALRNLVDRDLTYVCGEARGITMEDIFVARDAAA